MKRESVLCIDSRGSPRMRCHGLTPMRRDGEQIPLVRSSLLDPQP
jgi:hypothetical protein